MEPSSQAPFTVRMVRYVATRFRKEYPAYFHELDSAITWWAKASPESIPPPADFADDVRLLRAIARLVREALDGDLSSALNSHASVDNVVHESTFLYSVKKDFPDFDWERIFADMLLRERGYLYPSEKAHRIPNEDALKPLVGVSLPWREVMQKIRAAAAEEVTTLFVGETGTGKSFDAKALHDAGPRRTQPLITLACGRVNVDTIDGVVESLFNEADIPVDQSGAQSLFKFRGTLLLEEIGTLPPELQGFVLDGVERIEREREQKGSEGIFPRLIATTTAPLEQVYLEGGLRQDLLYRLAVFQVDLPPLRQRKEDISLLATNILRQLASKHRVMIPRFEGDAVKKLERHSWPGNIRELKNVLEAGLLQVGDRLGQEHLRFDRGAAGAVLTAKDPTMERILERLEKLGVRVSKGNPETLVQFLRYMAGRRFRTHELAEDLNVASSTARAYIHRLVDAGMIRKFGEKKGATYQVIENELFAE